MLLGQIQTLQTVHSHSHAVLQSWCDTLAKQLAGGQRPVFQFVEEFDQILAKMLPLLKGKTLLSASLYLLLDTLLFNVSANLERVRRIAQEAMVGGGQLESQKPTGGLEAFDKRIRELVERLVGSPQFRNVLLASAKQGSMKMSELSLCVQTCDYLAEHYQLAAKNYTQTRSEIEPLLCDPYEANAADIEYCNSLLFSSHAGRLASLVRQSQAFPRELHFSIFRILEANWIPTKKIRKLFSGCAIKGEEAMGVILGELLGRSTEEVLFSEGHSQTSEYSFVESYLLFRFLPVLYQFSSHFANLRHQHSESQFYSLNRTRLEQISRFLKALVGSKFGNFLHSLRRVLMGRRSEEEAAELLKLLLLNRFLLNPKLKLDYDKAHFNPKEYPHIANRVKALFFPSKLSLDIAKDASASIHAAYMELIETREASSEQKRYLYLNDCLLYLDYHKLAETFAKQRNILASPLQTSRPLHYASIQQSSLSTVQKQLPRENPSSVKRILKDISCHSNSERLGVSINTQHNTQHNYEEHEASKPAEQLPDQQINDLGIVQYLQTLRLEQSQRHRNRQQYLDSLRRSKRLFSSEFERLAERLNGEIEEIGQSRVGYELYEQLNRE